MRTVAAIVAAILASGCGSGERIAECDGLLATVDKLARCEQVSYTQRAQIEQSRASLKDSLSRLEDVGTERAPATILDEARQTCSKQNEEIQRMYEKVAADCVR